MILQLRHISRCFLVLWILCLASAGAAARTPQISPEGGSAERFGAVPEFSLTSSQGQTVTLQSLLGSPWVAVPFFVRCTGPCPNVTTDLRAVVYPELLESGAKLVSFSLDPNFDDPAALAEYAANYDIDTDRWLFLTGSSDAVVELIRGGLKIPLDFRPEADLEEGEQAIEHGTKLPVIDAEGQIAGWYEASRGKLGTGLTSGQADLDLLLGRVFALSEGPETSVLPLVNAYLNGSAFLLLVLGWFMIRTGREVAHERLMKLAFAVSAVFLASYLTYHFGVQKAQGPTPYNGVGWRKTAYLVMLASHVLLAIVNLPMILRVLWLARKKDWDAHRRLARKAFPIWLYVSFTGVLVYLLLYPWNPAPA